MCKKLKNDKPRQCFAILATQFDEHGYIPSLVTENEPGHAPMVGKDELAAPWYWGKTQEHAQQTCDRINKERYGLTRKAALRIVASSMFAGRV